MGANKYKTHSRGSLYKLWDTKGGFYLSGNSKSSWSTLHWVGAKLLDLAKWQKERFDSDNYEIHEFKISFNRVINATEILTGEQDKRNKKGAAKKRMEELQPYIMQYFPGIPDFRTALRMYSSGLMKESIVDIIQPLLTEYNECEKIAG
jgi:hypothetical protein